MKNRRKTPRCRKNINIFRSVFSYGFQRKTENLWKVPRKTSAFDSGFFEVATFKKYVLLHLSPLKFPKIFGADFFQGAIFMGLVTIFYFEQFLCIVSGTFWLTLHLCFDLLQTIYELFMQRWTTKSNISPSMVFRFYCWFFAAVIFFMDSKIIQKTALFGM